MSWMLACRGSASAVSRSQVPANAATSSVYDPRCPPGLTGELAGLIPKGQFLEAAGAGHEVHLSHAAWLAGQLTRWLAGH